MKKYLFSKRKLIVLLMASVMVFTFVACGDKDSSDIEAVVEAKIDTSLVGDYIGVGSMMGDIELGPVGEWLVLNDDGTGEWFLGAREETFTWTSEDDEIHFKMDIEGSDVKIEYTAKVVDGDIHLDTGMTYFFTKGEISGDSSEIIEYEVEDIEYIGWGYKGSKYLYDPSDWYGVAQLTNCEGFDFEEAEYDIWGYIDRDEAGTPYFEVWLDDEFETYPMISFYIQLLENEEWLMPDIGAEDAWIDIDYSDDYQVLTEDDGFEIMTPYFDGALDIIHTYSDDAGRSADCRFFIREIGTGWREDIDPLPPGFEEYKVEFSSIVDE